MAGTSAISGSASNYGNLASIRQQWKGIQERVSTETAARKAEQERTGLIRNPNNGEMVEISTLPDWQIERWEHRNEMATISPQEALIGFMASDPNAEEVERSKSLAARATKLEDKMMSGKKLTGAEKQFLRDNNYQYLAEMADRMEQEAAQLEQRLKGSTTKEGKYQAYIDAKMRIMSGANMSEGSDGGMMFLFAALDKAYAQHMKGGATSKLDIWA